MQYYTFKLNEDSKDLCTVTTPFGLYHYCPLPRGASCVLDVAPELMERTLPKCTEHNIYMDNVACLSSTWDKHFHLLEDTLD